MVNKEIIGVNIIEFDDLLLVDLKQLRFNEIEYGLDDYIYINLIRDVYNTLHNELEIILWDEIEII